MRHTDPLRSPAIILFLSMVCATLEAGATVPTDLISVDYKSLVSRADLDYATPVSRSEEGLPVGNGRMGHAGLDSAKFTLAARGAMRVRSSISKGQIEFVQIQSQARGECRMCNSWPGVTISVYCNGIQAENLAGPMAQFGTAKGEMIVVVPQGNTAGVQVP